MLVNKVPYSDSVYSSPPASGGGLSKLGKPLPLEVGPLNPARGSGGAL